MGAPKIRQSRKEAIHTVQRMKAKLRYNAKPSVTVLQDEITKKVLAVLIDRNAFSKFQEKTELDISHAEMIDFELFV